MTSHTVKSIIVFLFLLLAIAFVFNCSDPRKQMVGDRKLVTDPDAPVLGIEVRAAFDQQKIAMHFRWESSKDFAGQFRNLIAYDGEKWERVPGDGNMEEDRLAIMFEDPRRPVKGFANVGCYVACHADMNEMPQKTVDTQHYVLAESDEDVDAFALDMWHWRGARSGPMGYAEDTFVSRGKFNSGYIGRKRDAPGAPPTNWVRDRGDRLREDQPLNVGDWKGARLPRFVFNPEKVVFRNYFLADEKGNPIKRKEQLMAIESMDYASLKVIFQDYDFDPVDKVNAIDLLYLLYMANAIERPAYNPGWEPFWSKQLGVTNADQAAAMLDDIVGKMEQGVLVTRTVGFIYDSSQHDITAQRAFDYRSNHWSVTLYRDLRTGDELIDDVDLSGLHANTIYNLAFAVHDIGAARLWHNISFPYKLGNQESGADIQAHKVESIAAVNWDDVKPLKTGVYLPGAVSLQHLTSPGKHSAGASFVMQLTCMSCHTLDDIKGVANKSRRYFTKP